MWQYVTYVINFKAFYLSNLIPYMVHHVVFNYITELVVVLNRHNNTKTHSPQPPEGKHVSKSSLDDTFYEIYGLQNPPVEGGLTLSSSWPYNRQT